MEIIRGRAKSRGKKGFTLIEILVATVIMIILVGLVIQITTGVLTVWNRSAGKLATNAEARIAMDLLTQDLESAVFRDNGKQWLRVEGPLQAVGGGGDYDGQTVALKLFSSPAGANPPGLRAIGYRLAHKGAYEDAEDDVYALYRHSVDPSTTFKSVLGSLDEELQNQLTGGVWTDDELTNEENYLASNVVEFKILVYVDDGSGNVVLKNADEENLELEGGDYSFGGPGGDPEQPLYVDIVLKIVSDEGQRLLQNIANVQGTGSVSEKAEAIVREHGEIYTRRVRFAARPL